jgi:hypothetical protein
MPLEPGPPQLWHHQIHQHWAGEELYFLRLAFFPRYKRERVSEIVLEVMEEEGVLSLTLYEALGLFDLFMRVWVPSHAIEQLKRHLYSRLEGESLQLLESFAVGRILRHHVWEQDGRDDANPSDSLLRKPWEDAEIAMVNEGNLEPAREAKFQEDRVLAQLQPCQGVKFFTVITPATFPMPHMAHETLEEKLLEALDASTVEEPSLYAGSGFGEYVVMGRAMPSDFFAITELSTEINELGVAERISARPYTHVCAQPEPLFYADRLPLRDVERAFDLAALLHRHESATFEVKGSLRRDLKRWLSTDEVKPVPSDEIVNKGVLKAIVGMLNADGGQIVVGALERSKKFGNRKAEEHPKLAGLPRVGEYICVGVEGEFDERGWDGFRLDLHQMIANRIQPSPAGLISVSEEFVDGRPMCVIGVQPTRANWFYLNPGDSGQVSFYVRDGNRTVPYTGIDADAYKAERPRG